MRIQYFSDIHLEFGPLELPRTRADVIIAAGDIGIHKQGVEWLKTLGKPVIYVAGNHEFYDHELNATLAALRASSQGSNVHFLENERLILDGVRFLGCTLWTDLGGVENERLEDLQRSVNDFRMIRYGNEPFSTEIYMQLHWQSRDWLESELHRPYAGTTVVVTHHAPIQWSWNLSPNALKRYAYCNDLRGVMHKHGIATWIHGHTHSVSDYYCGATRILCNPRGYAGRGLVSGFKADKVIAI